MNEQKIKPWLEVTEADYNRMATNFATAIELLGEAKIYLHEYEEPFISIDEYLDTIRENA